MRHLVANEAGDNQETDHSQGEFNARVPSEPAKRRIRAIPTCNTLVNGSQCPFVPSEKRMCRKALELLQAVYLPHILDVSKLALVPVRNGETVLLCSGPNTAGNRIKAP